MRRAFVGAGFSAGGEAGDAEVVFVAGSVGAVYSHLYLEGDCQLSVVVEDMRWLWVVMEDRMCRYEAPSKLS